MAAKMRHFKERDGRYSARIVVPKHLRSIVGKAELESQLGGDRKTAVRNHAAALAELQGVITAAERRAKGETTVPARFPMSVQEIAVANYRENVAFDLELRQHSPDFANMGIDPGDVSDLRAGMAGKLTDDALDELVGYRIRRFQQRGNTDAAKGSPEWRKLAIALCASEYEILSRHAERNEGDFTGTPSHPVIADAPAPEEKHEPVSLTGLFNDYIRELKRGGRGEAAEQRWVPVFDHLRKYLKHNDATRLTKKDVIAWRDHLLETLSPRTVRDTYLASLKAILNWAAENERIPANPAQGVKVKLAKETRTREKGYRDDEALTIIKTTLAYQPPERESAQIAAAKKWTAVLCAFTGARIVEITQLRKEDIRDEDGTPVMRITPDAGSVKSGHYRDVPLHPQVVELGFLDFVDGSPAGPLFHQSKPDKALIGARTAAGRVSNWLKATGVVPEGVSPNHGWRHRFKTLASELGISDRVADAIQGHAPRTAGDGYGDVTIKARKLAIERLQWFTLAK